MSEIEKMYENVGVIKKRGCEYNSESCGRQDFIPCNLCAIHKEMIYPPFTAKKQIELIKWLSDFADFGTFSIDHDKSEYGIAFCVNDDGYYFVDKIFEECIAKVVKNLWQDLSPKERKQIKEILE